MLNVFVFLKCSLQKELPMMKAKSSHLKGKSSTLGVTRKILTALRFEYCWKFYFHRVFKDCSGLSSLNTMKRHNVLKTDKELLKSVNYINQYAHLLTVRLLT